MIKFLDIAYILYYFRLSLELSYIYVSYGILADENISLQEIKFILFLNFYSKLTKKTKKNQNKKQEMSWNDFYSQSLKLDTDIINNLETLISCQAVNDIYLDQKSSQLLEEPIFDSPFENFAFNEIKPEMLLKVIDVMKSERLELIRLFNLVNNERKVQISL